MADVELIVIRWLMGVDGLADVFVAAEFGPNQTWPALRITRLGGTRPWPPHLDAARVQIEGWATTKAEALAVLEAALAALADMPGAHADGVVTAVAVNVAPSWSPDPETNEPRYVADVTVTTHPNVEGDGS